MPSTTLDGSTAEIAGSVLGALRTARHGRVYSLALPRFPGMPLWSGHPEFQVLTYRSPQGLRSEGIKAWSGENEVGLGYIAETVSGSVHTGAHIDAHAHMTIGEDDHWYGGSAKTDLGDFGPLKGDASELQPILARGLFYDVPRHRGVDSLGKGEPITAAELEEISRNNDMAGPGPGDVVLIRTGYLHHWPDPQALLAHSGAGPDISVADWLIDRGVRATGTDTEAYEVQPPPNPGSPANPQPVHTRLLIEHGIHLMESLFLEELGAAGLTEFLFIALPLKIKGATGSMIDPIAVS
ncbi:cyclase family protein [Microlunatus sp. Gsoil 973]|nr:cyclase family protein [Microlunatus sp. Gsoil 973]